jgi:hypothetical protein
MGQGEIAALPDREYGDKSAKRAGVNSKRERDGATPGSRAKARSYIRANERGIEKQMSR